MDSVKLQKYFSDCGVMSRRAAEEEIKKGLVKVNGATAELGTRICPDTDTVEYKGKPIRPLQKGRIYLMLNKPRGYVTTLSDEKGRRTVAELTRSAGARVYPVGRLDMDSDGLLLLTNDGELTNRLTHPRHEIPKIYQVSIEGRVSEEQLQQLRAPMDIDGYEILPVKTERLEYSQGSTLLCMTLYEGRNRQIRKMCEKCGLRITRLCRVAIGSLSLGGLEVGKWRELTADEVDYLYGKDVNLKGNENA